MNTEETIQALSHHYSLHADAKMNDKTTLKALEHATATLEVGDDATADRKILIAVDFGTTFSGVAWAQTRRV